MVIKLNFNKMKIIVKNSNLVFKKPEQKLIFEKTYTMTSTTLNIEAPFESLGIHPHGVGSYKIIVTKDISISDITTYQLFIKWDSRDGVKIGDFEFGKEYFFEVEDNDKYTNFLIYNNSTMEIGDKVTWKLYIIE